MTATTDMEPAKPKRAFIGLLDVLAAMISRPSGLAGLVLVTFPRRSGDRLACDRAVRFQGVERSGNPQRAVLRALVRYRQPWGATCFRAPCSGVDRRWS